MLQPTNHRQRATLVVLACLVGRSAPFQSIFLTQSKAHAAFQRQPFFGRGYCPTELHVLQSAPQQQESSVLTNGSTGNSPSLGQEQNHLNSSISELSQADLFARAVAILEEAEEAMNRDDAPSDRLQSEEASFAQIFSALAAQYDSKLSSLYLLEKLFKRMTILSKIGRPGFTPTASTYNSLILAWSKSFRKDAGTRCDNLLSELWIKYHETQDSCFVPLKSTYVSTMAALARSGRGRWAAQRIEELLEEMERHHLKHPSLAPSTICVNIALHAWSRSGGRTAARRCEAILDRMEDLYFRGRTELQPNTTSFNTVIDALAKSNELGSEQRAEALLERMEELSLNHEDLRYVCAPDLVSFNAVLNCWARSPSPKAAQRADVIFRHMERRFADGITGTRPDAATYNTVLTAWSRSRDRQAATRAAELLRNMEKAYRRGNTSARPTAMSHNIVINAWARSKESHASLCAMDIFQSMKDLAAKEGRDDCRPDVFSYTSLIDVLAKTTDQSDKAVELLEELEDMYNETGDATLRPDVRTYTSVIQAISRSRSRPERAERIVNRLEGRDSDGALQSSSSKLAVFPDVVCYDALINAYGWSTQPGRSLKCYSIYQRMLHLYSSKTNIRVKPDIITCNSILNACAYEDADSDKAKAEILDVAVHTLEDFQTRAPDFGLPNHITYANMLLAILKHTTSSTKDNNADGGSLGKLRTELAEATFWQCCEGGHVSVLVINNLYQVLEWDRFSHLMGKALLSGKGENLHFNWRNLPSQWTRSAPSPAERRDSPSRKRLSNGIRTKSN